MTDFVVAHALLFVTAKSWSHICHYGGEPQNRLRIEIVHEYFILKSGLKSGRLSCNCSSWLRRGVSVSR